MPFPPTTPRPAASATAHRAVPPRAMPAVLGDARDRRLWLCIATSTLLTLCLVRGAGLSITGATPFLLCGLAAVALRLAGPLLVPTRAAGSRRVVPAVCETNERCKSHVECIFKGRVAPRLLRRVAEP